MKSTKTFFRGLMMCTILFVLSLTSSCSFEQATPISAEGHEKQITTRTEGAYSGLEDVVREKVSVKYSIPENDITSVTYLMETAQGWGRYSWTSTGSSGFYTITGIIGDDYDGF